jgi:hypothetical protein
MPGTLSKLTSSPIGILMRTRHGLVMTLATAALAVAPSFAGAQRSVTRDCVDRYSIDGRRYADCRYEIDRSREVQREASRERAEQQRERVRWDGIVREAKTQARSYDLAARSRERATERTARARMINEQRQDRIRERGESVLRDRSYRVR